MTAVVVWTHLPDAETLLEARLQRGWQPVESAVEGKNKILGYAACTIPDKS
ncbi:MAG: hypothetical protein ACPG7F_22570 [Aggregatilineales bacterium]